MVLVDTSVWIRFMYGREPYLHDLDSLLALGEAVSHQLVYGELLVKDPGGQRTFLENYRHLPQAAVVPHEEVVSFVNHRVLHGRVRWIEAHLLASALVGGSSFGLPMRAVPLWRRNWASATNSLSWPPR
jgi:hypothetical protein